MIKRGNTWAIVLAAGEGSRLRQLTTDAAGVATPKQYWSLSGGRSLLGDAVLRARRIAPKGRVLIVVAAEPEHLWRDELAAVPPQNLIVQPANRGTAPGILLPLMAIRARDPEARFFVLPSDHFVRKEHVLETALRAALAGVDAPDEDGREEGT